MGRDASASSKSRRASGTFDPNDSFVRRVKGGQSAAARASAAGAKSLPAPPRNRRVRAAPRARTGPSLFARMRLGLLRMFQLPGRMGAAFAGRVRAWSARAAGPSSIILRALGVCACLGGSLALGRFVYRHLTTAPGFAVDSIELKGQSFLERDELLQVAGIELGMNVFARNPNDVRARLLRHPWIVSAKVTRELPSRFAIELRERMPVALLSIEACDAAPFDDEDGRCDEPSSLYLVSEDARTFKRVGSKEIVDLPVVTGITRQRLREDPELQQRALGNAVGLLDQYRRGGLWQRAAVSEIHLEPDEGLSLYIGEDLTYVRLGAPPYPQKLLRMKRVLERLAREHARAEYIYLDNEQRPDRVAVRLR